jgi:cytochrome c biogenesis protein CcmG/thiol:disulfide interchange protein DsbE
VTEVVDDPVADDARSTSSGSARLAPFIALGVAVVMIGLLVVLVGAEPDTGPDGSFEVRPAPEAVGTLDDGTFFDLSRRKGSYVVLNFFTSDCVPCIQEHPELIEFVDQQRQLGTAGAEFYSVVVGDTQERVEKFFDERGGDWPIIYSDADEFSVAFGVAAVPETWVIDAEGIIRARFISRVTAEGLSVTLQQLREALGS